MYICLFTFGLRMTGSAPRSKYRYLYEEGYYAFYYFFLSSILKRGATSLFDYHYHFLLKLHIEKVKVILTLLELLDKLFHLRTIGE